MSTTFEDIDMQGGEVIKEDDRQTVVRFPNGFGASVISDAYSYGGSKGLFEVAVVAFPSPSGRGRWGLTYDTDITSDVEGYLTLADVDALLVRIAALDENGKEKSA